MDRAYSDYQQVVRKGRETRTFDEAIQEAIEGVNTRLPRKEDEVPEHGERTDLNDEGHDYLRRGIYVEHLLHWSRFFPEEQMLVLKSEDFFERPWETLKPVLDFLDLPDWKPVASEVISKKRNRATQSEAL